MNLSNIRQILNETNLRLTKSLGQNFLHDGNQLNRIIKAAELAAGDQVLEIGPGLGPLTELLLAQPVVVTAIEIDYRLYEILRQRLGAAANLKLIHADALAHLQTQPLNWAGWKVVANLPYSVGTPILVELALHPQGPTSMTVTLQLEVAQRLMARPGQPEYGVLSLLIQLNYTVAHWFKIPAGCFFPPPDVDSACVTLQRRNQPLLNGNEKTVFIKLVKLGFSQRRKMALKLWRQAWPEEQLMAACAAVGISPQTRAEALSLEQFCALAQSLNESHGNS